MKDKIKDLYVSIVKITKKSIRDEITNFYFASRDFNGISASRLCEKYVKILEYDSDEFGSDEFLIRYITNQNFDTTSFSYKKIIKILKQLVFDEEITVVYDLNPHIKRYPDRPIDEQLKFLDEQYFKEIGLYPAKKYLESINPSGFETLPFKRKMLLGCSQVFPQYFELKVLEEYANDPRFTFDFSDYSGRASIKDEFDSSTIVLDRDKMFIERFGIGYKESDDRRVAVLWVSDLANFTSEHQRRWETYIIEEKCNIDPDFYRNQVVGEWAENVGIYSAFLEEIKVINLICINAGWPKLFKHEFVDCPSGFRIPFNSTSNNFFNFARLLDKMLSDNLNSKFFKKVLREHERILIQRDEETGQDEIIRLGTIILLEKFLKKNFVPANGFAEIDEMTRVFKKIRKLRSDASHNLLENRFHLDYEKKHDKLINNAYKNIRLLRLILSNEPTVRPRIKDLVPDWLYEGKIRNYYFYSLDGIDF